MIQAIIFGIIIWVAIMIVHHYMTEGRAKKELAEKKKSNADEDRLYVAVENFMEKFKDGNPIKVSPNSVFISDIRYTVKIDANTKPCKCTIFDENGVQIFSGASSMCMVIIRNFMNKIS